MAPSPTAEATRLIDPCRRSPAANTPGMLVSSSKGARLVGHDAVSSLAERSRTRQHETAPVARDGSTEPFGVRLGTDQGEEGVGRHLDGARLPIPQCELIKLGGFRVRPPPASRSGHR